MMKKIILCFVFTLLFFLSALPFSIKQLGIEKGLSSNYVVSIAQDKQGFLWFATEEGLNKFDGTRFIPYYKNETKDKQEITGNELNWLLDDPTDSILWIGTQRAGLNAYNYATNTFTSYRHDDANPNSLATDDVTSITTASDGNLWISTYWKGIDYFDKKTGCFTHYNMNTVPKLASNHIWTIADGDDGNLYIGHEYDGFSILSIEDKRVKHFMHDPKDSNSLPGNTVRCVYRDKRKNIWVGTDGGLALYNPGSDNFTSFHRIGPHNIADIRELDNNELWIATELGGIYVLTLPQQLFMSAEAVQFRHIRHGDDEYSLSNPSVRCIFQDSFGNVWAGVWGSGVNFLKREPSIFNVYRYSPIQSTGSSLNNKAASSVCFDRTGKMWVGTDGGGLNVFDQGRRVAVYNKESGDLRENSVQATFCDSEGVLWLGLFMGGVSYFDFRQNHFQPLFPSSHSKVDARVFSEDSCHNLWIGTSTGVYKVNVSNKKNITHYSCFNNLVRAIAHDADGNLWIGTFGGGIGVYDSDFNYLRGYDTSSNFPSNTINIIYKDSKKRLWVGTGEGLVCFGMQNDKEYTVYRREDGLQNTHIRSIAEDEKGNIWLGTNKGISCLLTEKNEIFNYNFWDELPMENCISGSVAKDSSGNIYFGSVNGLFQLNPHFILQKHEAPPAVITEMKIFDVNNNNETSEGSINTGITPNIKLSYAHNSFSISFNIQNFALANQVEYAYCLKGLEDKWYTVTGQNYVIFRNIPPGSYRFMVKTRIKNQEWSTNVTTLDIVITPPLWFTWWAILIYVIVGAFIVIFIVLAYKKKLDVEMRYKVEKKKHEQEHLLNEERIRFYTNITHELRTPLTLIIGPLEDMQNNHSLSGKDAKKLSIIHKSAIRLLNLINQILEFRKTETQNKKLCISKNNISELVYEIGLKYKELNQKPHLDILIQVENEYMPLFFDREAVTIILDNLISNAIKYTGQGRISIEAYQTKRNGIHYTEIKVTDTGFGITKDALPHIFDRYYQEGSTHQASGTGIGLSLVKNLVALHEGQISVESVVGQGSCFCFSLLTDNTYPNLLHGQSAPEAVLDKPEPAEEPGLEAVADGKQILLIVEDDLDICSYINEAFRHAFHVITTSNGKEGMEQALEFIPDIIVSDIMMPIMDGIAMCQRLKEDVRTSHIPIILLTAKDLIADKELGYQAGADSYLTKPFSATLLQSRIFNLLESRKRLVERFKTTTIANIKDKSSTIFESMNKLDNEFITKINSLIEEQLFSDKVDVANLSDHMCMSKSTLYRKMKALTGLSANEYIRKVKMQHAEKFLLSGKYTISEIAFKVGINTSVYFRQCFKEEFGMLPSDYLKQIKNERPSADTIDRCND